MAIFLCNFKNITRSEGRSAVAAAAYRSGEKIKNVWDGVEHDYIRKGGVVYKNVLLPDNAPVEYKERSVLWNEVELAEKASDSRLCRECLLALPLELSRQEQIALVEDYIKKNFVSLGMCADIAIHDPVLTDDLHRPIDRDGNPTKNPAEYQHNNPHAHILFTVRPINKNGKWAAKTQKEYLCKRGDEKEGFTADEFKIKKSEGWEKQYRYINQIGKKVWMTPTEAAGSGLTMQDRISRSPRSTPHGRENPKTAYWNDKDRIVEWRRSWADMCNAKFQTLGINAFVDHRSYADQGINKLPQEHMGSYANEIEKRARRLEREGVSADKIHHTEIGDRNRQVADYNKSVEACKKTDQAADNKIRATARQMEHLRSKLIYNSCVSAVIGSGLTTALDASRQKEADIQNVADVVRTMTVLQDKSLELIASLTKALADTPAWQPRQRRELQAQINDEQSKLHDREEYVKVLLGKHNIPDKAALQQAKEQQSKEVQFLERKGEQISLMEQSSEKIVGEYTSLKDSVPPVYQSRINDSCSTERIKAEADIQEQLHNDLEDGFSTLDYERSVSKVEHSLGGKAVTGNDSKIKVKVYRRSR